LIDKGEKLFCQKCGKEIPEGSSYCPNCGQKATLGNSGSLNAINDEEYKAFIGPRSDNYLERFNKFNKSGIDRFVFTWHWPAFFIGFWWLLYRKMYFWSLIAFGVWWLPHLALPGMFIWGAVGNYLYYLQVHRKILDYKKQTNEGLPITPLNELGGVNRWVWVLGLIVSLIFIAGFGLSAVMLYRFLTRGYLTVQDYVEIGFSSGGTF